MQGRYVNAASRAGQAASFIRPEILAIPKARINDVPGRRPARPLPAPARAAVALSSRTRSAGGKRSCWRCRPRWPRRPSQAFGQLNDADLKFGTVTNEKGERIELTHASFSTLLHSPKRSVRREAFHKYYAQYAAHENTLAATLARLGPARRLLRPGAQLPERAGGGAVSRPRAAVGLRQPDRVGPPAPAGAATATTTCAGGRCGSRDIHQYDTYVPILSDLQVRRTWDQAVDLVLAALAPLGSDYCGALEQGLRGRWCDRYENRGKQSGAFSCGSLRRRSLHPA